jgi:hypothetical protein
MQKIILWSLFTIVLFSINIYGAGDFNPWGNSLSAGSAANRRGAGVNNVARSILAHYYCNDLLTNLSDFRLPQLRGLVDPHNIPISTAILHSAKGLLLVAQVDRDQKQLTIIYPQLWTDSEGTARPDWIFGNLKLSVVKETVSIDEFFRDAQVALLDSAEGLKNIQARNKWGSWRDMARIFIEGEIKARLERDFTSIDTALVFLLAQNPAGVARDWIALAESYYLRTGDDLLKSAVLRSLTRSQRRSFSPLVEIHADYEAIRRNQEAIKIPSEVMAWFLMNFWDHGLSSVGLRPEILQAAQKRWEFHLGPYVSEKFHGQNADSAIKFTQAVVQFTLDSSPENFQEVLNVAEKLPAGPGQALAAMDAWFSSLKEQNGSLALAALPSSAQDNTKIEELVEYLSDRYGIPIAWDLFRHKASEVRPQTAQRGRFDRLLNMAHQEPFVLGLAALKNHTSIILVDDIQKSGATSTAATRQLMSQSGLQEIFTFHLAKIQMGGP